MKLAEIKAIMKDGFLVADPPKPNVYPQQVPQVREWIACVEREDCSQAVLGEYMGNGIYSTPGGWIRMPDGQEWWPENMLEKVIKK